MYSRIFLHLIDLVEDAFWTLAGPLPTVGGKICRPLTLLLPPAVHSAFRILFSLFDVVQYVCSVFPASISFGIAVAGYRDCS